MLGRKTFPNAIPGRSPCRPILHTARRNRDPCSVCSDLSDPITALAADSARRRQKGREGFLLETWSIRHGLVRRRSVLSWKDDEGAVSDCLKGASCHFSFEF